MSDKRSMLPEERKELKELSQRYFNDPAADGDYLSVREVNKLAIAQRCRIQELEGIVRYMVQASSSSYLPAYVVEAMKDMEVPSD